MKGMSRPAKLERAGCLEFTYALLTTAARPGEYRGTWRSRDNASTASRHTHRSRVHLCAGRSTTERLSGVGRSDNSRPTTNRAILARVPSSPVRHSVGGGSET